MTGSDVWRNEAKRIVQLVKTHFLLPDGALGIEREEGTLRPYHIFPDLGDTLPFLDYFGEHDFVEQQMQLYLRSLENGYLVSQFPTFGISGLVKSYEYTDLLLGLIWYEESSSNAKHRRSVLRQAITAAFSAFRVGRRQRSFYHLSTGLRLPVFDTRDSMFIESLVVLYRKTKDDEYILRAKRLFRYLTETRFFRRYGMFADYEPVGLVARVFFWNNRKFWSSSICKHTSSALFAFIELYRTCPDPSILRQIEHLINGLNLHAVKGGVLERFDPKFPDNRITLTASFAILDGLCDCAYFIPALRHRCEQLAVRIADFWLARQGSTGLFPFYADGSDSFIDSETDMSIALFKLTEITGNERYREAGETCIRGIIQHHGAARYCLSVNVETGEVRNPAQRTKFLCLFLKALILSIESESGSTIYGNTRLFELLKDR